MTDTWVAKLPKDMTNDELQAARGAVAPALVAAQTLVNNLTAASLNVLAEIGTRFDIEGVPGLVNPGTLPAYPSDAIAAAFDSDSKGDS